MPIPVQFALNVRLTKRIAEAEKETLEGLEKAGFKIDSGCDGSGIHRKYVTRGGGYYIDIGCSQLIIDGKIKIVQSPAGISYFTNSEVVLMDGRAQSADIVVLATVRTCFLVLFSEILNDIGRDLKSAPSSAVTLLSSRKRCTDASQGYDDMRTSVRKVFGSKLADQIKDVWDLDEEGEVKAMWRDSGHPGFVRNSSLSIFFLASYFHFSGIMFDLLARYGVISKE